MESAPTISLASCLIGFFRVSFLWLSCNNTVSSLPNELWYQLQLASTTRNVLNGWSDRLSRKLQNCAGKRVGDGFFCGTTWSGIKIWETPSAFMSFQRHPRAVKSSTLLPTGQYLGSYVQLLQQCPSFWDLEEVCTANGPDVSSWSCQIYTKHCCDMQKFRKLSAKTCPFIIGKPDLLSFKRLH